MNGQHHLTRHSLTDAWLHWEQKDYIVVGAVCTEMEYILHTYLNSFVLPECRAGFPLKWAKPSNQS